MTARLMLTAIVLAAGVAGCGGSSKSSFPTVGAARTYALVDLRPSAPAAVGKPTQVSFTIRKPDGKPLTRYRHGAGPHNGVHLIIVRRDLSTIIHRHPPISADGSIHDTVTFTKPGAVMMGGSFTAVMLMVTDPDAVAAGAGDLPLSLTSIVRVSGPV